MLRAGEHISRTGMSVPPKHIAGHDSNKALFHVQESSSLQLETEAQ